MKIIFALIVGNLLAMPAWAGNEMGNGGDAYSQEFVALGQKLVAQLEKNPNSQIANVEAFREAVSATRVVTAEHLMLRDAEVDALNFPERKEIQINRLRWKDYDEKQKMALVLHEYLGVSAVANDSNYQVSGSYLGENPKPIEHRLYLNIHSGYSSQLNRENPSRPSFGAAFGFNLTTNAYFFAGLDSYKFQDNYFFYQSSNNLLKFSVGGKYVLPLSEHWKPYFAGAINYYDYSASYLVPNSSSDFDVKLTDTLFGYGTEIGISYQVDRLYSLNLAIGVDAYFNDRISKDPLGTANIGLIRTF